MAITLWAGTSNSTVSNWTESNNMLPSPTEIEMTLEEIWNADAGRNAKGTMIATYVAQKITYNIKWGVLTSTEFSKITGLLTNGFFKFTRVDAYNGTNPPTTAGTYYRSEISYSLIQAGATRYYKDVSVSVIQK